jgi:hypothetical protein
MANFTQLHLSNKSQEPSQKDRTNNGPSNQDLSRQKVLFGSGLLAVTVLSGVFLLITNGCSKGPAKVAGQDSADQNASNQPSTALPAPVVATAVVPAGEQPVRKHVVQKKAPTATFSDPVNGVSFRYPKTYVLKTGDEPSLDLAGMGSVQMDFAQPGGTTLAAIELPRNSYPGTDFSSAFFSVSVNPELSASECEQFAFPLHLQDDDPGAPAKAKIGGTEFNMVEDFSVTDHKEPSLKYYHRFQNGNCYEFSMGLGTIAGAGDGVQPVNREQVFRKLERILATVKLQPGVLPQVANGTSHPMVEGSKE